MRIPWTWLSALAACAGLATPVAAEEKILVFAAASLREAMTAAVRQYQRESGLEVVQSYASSSTLVRQIERGAPAAIIVSANPGWMDYLETRGLIKQGSRRNLLRNELVLIAPAGSVTKLAIRPQFALAKALGQGRLAMANPDHVPAGQYAKAALQSLGVWSSVAARIARGENVRTALNFVSRGEAPFGIVYRTDAVADSGVRIVDIFPPETHPPIIYPVALVSSSANPSAERLLSFLESAEAAAIFRQNGFMPY